MVRTRHLTSVSLHRSVPRPAAHPSSSARAPEQRERPGAVNGLEMFGANDPNLVVQSSWKLAKHGFEML